MTPLTFLSILFVGSVNVIITDNGREVRERGKDISELAGEELGIVAREQRREIAPSGASLEAQW